MADNTDTVDYLIVGAGASGALNQWFDADIDAVMTRTRTRPIPAGSHPIRWSPGAFSSACRR